MKFQTFDNFLEEYWMKKYYEGQTKDEAYDATQDWISELETEELLELANEYGRQFKSLCV